MDSLVRFGLGSIEAYTFVQANQAEYQDNFTNIMQQSSRVPGKDGGISPYGLGRGAAEVGNVRVSFWVHGDSMADVGAKVDLIHDMAYWGVRRLFKTGRNGEMVWTWASVSSVQDAQVARRMPSLRQQVQMTFQCTETEWYGKTGMLFFNDDWILDGNTSLAALKVDRQAVSDGSVVSVTNRGNAPVSAYVRWDGDGVDTIINPVITRKNWLGEVVDQLTYMDTIGINEVVVIDARGLSCTDITKLSYAGLNWLTIPSGTWDLEISGTFAGTGLLTVDFWDGWV